MYFNTHILENRFSELLKKFRKSKGKSQSELYFAVFGKKSSSAVSNWEKGTSKPSLDDFFMLCAYFNITPDELLLGDIYTDLGMVQEGKPAYGKIVDCIETEQKKYTKEEIVKLETKLETLQEIISKELKK